MLRIIQNSNVPGAKSYYCTSDYYSEGQELVGHWHGKGAERLGLSGEISKQDWDALCDNRNPATGKVLTLRQKQARRVGYDFNFHVPKSVSVLYGLTGDERIVAAFRDSVEATMDDIEAEIQTRIRVGGRNEDRMTGNMVWGEFIHSTARPVDGMPDPHLHAHCFAFNTTWDPVEERWKAGQFAGVKRDAPYFEALFHARLAMQMMALGIPVERTRTGWELRDVPTSTLKAFSRRTALIEALAKEHGVVNPVAKGQLGAKTRQKKRKELSMAELRREWESRLDPAELAAIGVVAGRLGAEPVPGDERAVPEAVAAALDHSFERSSVVPERTLLAAALKRNYGLAAPSHVISTLKARPLITVEREGRLLATLPKVLREEEGLIAFAREGRGTAPRLGVQPGQFRRPWLSDGQRRAVSRVLGSHDRVTLIRGAAGVGKTAMMQEAVEGIEAGGHRVLVFAPSAEASRGVLRDQEGFDEADTVARLLVDEKLQERLQGQVMWIDEAGLLGSRDMGRVFELAKRLDTRVVLSGDRRQHGSVERGAALRLLEQEAGLVPAELKEIQRQQGDYKLAVAALGEGDTARGFRRLDALGWIKEVPADARYEALAKDYVATVEEGKSALVVSPTHREGERISEEIRSRLKRAGVVGPKDREIRSLESLNYTEAERADAASYTRDDVLVFHQNAKGYQKGDRVTVRSSVLPVDQAKRFQVYRQGRLSVAAGDVLRITRNGTTKDGNHRLNNGALVKVKGFTKAGDLVLTNGWTVDKDYGHLAHGLVVTSHTSQGRTVDRVFIGQSSLSLPAASREQFYVSVSRGRERAVIYTDDKRSLLEAVSRSDPRMTAMELAREARSRQSRQYAAHRARQRDSAMRQRTSELEADRA